MIQVCDYDILIVLVELNTLIYVRPLSEWQNLKLGHFEVGNFDQKLALFSDFCSHRDVRIIQACAYRQVISEYTSQTPGSFLEYDPSPSTVLQGVLNDYFKLFLKSSSVYHKHSLKARYSMYLDAFPFLNAVRALSVSTSTHQAYQIPQFESKRGRAMHKHCMNLLSNNIRINN